jgi:transcriptional regulator with XRE-family HTH domain
MANPKTKGPDPIDQHVGSRMRSRRRMLGVNQEKFAHDFGLTFQQIQKYEKGMNRMAASRLLKAAGILDVPVSFFFEGGDGGPYKPNQSDLSPSYIDDFVSSSDGLRRRRYGCGVGAVDAG